MKETTTPPAALTEFTYSGIKPYKNAIARAPQKAWLKQRELGGGKNSTYIPLPILESLADKVFESWDVVDEKFEVIVNEVAFTVKIQYIPDYPGADIRFATGSGSAPIQCRKGSEASEFPKGKITNSLQYCLPAARAFAISNAMATIGNIFGRNLNRNIANNHSFNKE